MGRERSAVRAQSWLAALVLGASVLAGITTGSAGATPRQLARCTSREFGSGLHQSSVPRSSRSPRAIALTVGWLTARERQRDCILRTTIRLEIIGPDGVAALRRWRATGVLHPWTETVHTWTWRNWCPADHGSGTVTVKFSLPS